jgi:PAS domain S-box-containing protein
MTSPRQPAEPAVRAPAPHASRGPEQVFWRRTSELAWVPIVLWLAAILVLWVANVRVVWSSPFGSGLLHYGSAILGVALIVLPAARSFLSNGQPSVLMLGSGVLMSQIGTAGMAIGLWQSTSTAFAIYNTSILASALCHFTGIAVTARRPIRLGHPSRWLVAAYAGAVATMLLVGWLAFSNRMPIFFIDDQGSTLWRTLVVSAATALFLLTALLLARTNRRTPSPFLHWYSLGLVLLGAGLAGSLLIVVKDSPLQWATRLTQVFGLVYMCVAVLSALRENDARDIPLAAVEEAWRENLFLASFHRQTPLTIGMRYGLALGLTVLSLASHLALTAGVGPGLPTYITFYPAVMVAALLGGLGPGLAATATSLFVVTMWVVPPLGQLAVESPVDRLGLAIFGCLGAFMSLFADLYRRDRQRVAAYERELVLRESQARLAAFAEATFEGIVESDEGRIVDCNEQFARMTGYCIADLKGTEIAALISPEDRSRVMPRIQESLAADAEHEMLRKDGSRMVVETHGRPMSQGSARRHTAIRDITARKRAEEELRQANMNLEEKVRKRTAALDQRAIQLRALAGEITLAEQRERRRMATMLHDHLQQLLVGAKFRTAILGRRAEPLVKLAAGEIENLLDEAISASRSLTAELSPPILHEGGLLPGLEWLARWMADRHGLIVDLVMERDIPPLVEDVKILLFESVRELLFNAVKHARVHNVSVNLRLTGGKSLQITVSDAGPGFDPSKLKAPGSTGGGFGLFSIRERLSLIGGRLDVRSSPGKGSRFMLITPIAVTTAGPLKLPAAAVVPEEDRPVPAAPLIFGAKIRVLLADDHAVMRQGLRSLLASEFDIEVVGEAADGREAIDLATSLRPNVVLMDMSMPKVAGLEATRMIHADLPDVRIIGLSMFDEKERADAMIAAGASAYLTKSGPAGDLIATIRSCMGSV